MTKKERDGKDNMQIRVLQQSREIFATYSLEDAKMELCISLPQNYPLGAIKVDSTKHIGGKLHARQVVMQLSIYLTHQVSLNNNAYQRLLLVTNIFSKIAVDDKIYFQNLFTANFFFLFLRRKQNIYLFSYF